MYKKASHKTAQEESLIKADKKSKSKDKKKKSKHKDAEDDESKDGSAGPKTRYNEIGHNEN